MLRKLDYDAPVVWDEVNDAWDTGRRALLCHPSSATHHVVIQDDAIVCHDLIAGVRQMLEFVPSETPVGLYVGGFPARRSHWKTMIRRAENAGHCWIADRTGSMWGVALVIPTTHIRAIVSQGDRVTRQLLYDGRIRRWYFNSKITGWYTVPSLVDHRTGDGEPSMIPRRVNLARSAYRFIGETGSALDVNWAPGVTR
jgi:hypothetical protein